MPETTAAERKAIIRAAMQIISRIRTPKRAAAARRNGKLGGRPRKKKTA